MRTAAGGDCTSDSSEELFKEAVPPLLLSRFRRVLLFATPWTAAYQAPPSMGFSRQEYWSGLPLPSLKEAVGDGQYIRFWCTGRSLQSSAYFTKGFLLVMRSQGEG